MLLYIFKKFQINYSFIIVIDLFLKSLFFIGFYL